MEEVAIFNPILFIGEAGSEILGNFPEISKLVHGKTVTFRCFWFYQVFSNLFILETRDSFQITCQKMHMALCFVGIKLAESGVVLIIAVKDGKILLSMGHLDPSNLVVWRSDTNTWKVYKVMLSLLDWGSLSYADGYSKRITSSVFESCWLSWQNGST